MPLSSMIRRAPHRARAERPLLAGRRTANAGEHPEEIEMRAKLLTGIAAAALIAGAGMASAQTQLPQGDQKAPGATPPPAAIQNAPPEKVGEPLKKNQDRMRQDRATTGQASPDSKRPMNAQTPRANDKSATDKKASDKAATGNNRMNKNNNAASESKSTTGQGAAASQGAAKLNTEQRTKITTVIKEQKVQPVTNVNFSVSVGTRVPRAVHLHPLPAPVIAVYPAWRGFEFILVGDEIVVIDPGTLEIVAVIPA
jgi:hypothetical protein